MAHLNALPRAPSVSCGGTARAVVRSNVQYLGNLVSLRVGLRVSLTNVIGQP